MAWVPNTAMSVMGPNTPHYTRASDVTGVMLMTVVVGARKRPLDQKRVEGLMEDIKRQGLLQPIGVRATQGRRGGPLELVFGHHRFAAFSALGPEYDSIPAIIFPSDTPDWQVELAEISENLNRKELSPPERDAQAARYAAIVMAQLGVKAARRHGERGTAKKTDESSVFLDPQRAEPDVDPRMSETHRRKRKPKPKPEPEDNKPTAVEIMAKEWGIDPKTAKRRLKSAAKAIGIEKLNLDEVTPEQMAEIGRKAQEQVEETKKARAEKNKNTAKANAKAKKAVEAAEQKAAVAVASAEKKVEAGENSTDEKTVDVMATDEMVAAFVALKDAIDLAERTEGIHFVQAVIRKWWADKSGNKGEVRFNPKSFANGVD